MPGDFVNQEFVQLVVPSIIIVGADIIHIPVKIEGIGDLSERGAQSFFQAHEVLQRNCHFSLPTGRCVPEPRGVEALIPTE